jgi:small subunit ribosomal protein S16
MPYSTLTIDLNQIFDILFTTMLKIRLQRTGRKHEPTFRVVLTDSKNGPKSGRNQDTQLKKDRIQYWIGQGAQVSDTMHNLLITHEVIAGEKKNVLPLKTPIRKEQPVEETPAPAPAAEEVAPAEAPASEATEVPAEETPAQE